MYNRQPTPEQQAAICAALARAMGWRELPLSTVESIPDCFTDPATSRALVEWLAADYERWEAFYRVFAVMVGTRRAGQVDVVLAAMTAPLAVIALAAYEAIKTAK